MDIRYSLFAFDRKFWDCSVNQRLPIIRLSCDSKSQNKPYNLQ